MKFGFIIQGIVDVADVGKLTNVVCSLDPKADIAINQIKDEPPKQIEDKTNRNVIRQMAKSATSSDIRVQRVYRRSPAEDFETSKLLIAILSQSPRTYKEIEPYFKKAQFMPKGAHARMSELIKRGMVVKTSDLPATFDLTSKGKEFYKNNLIGSDILKIVKE